MGNVLQFRKPGTRMFPSAVADELYKLSSDIRELEIGQRRYVAQELETPKSHVRQLLKTNSRMRKLLENHCTKGSASNAKQALYLYGCLYHRDIELIHGDEELFESIVRMRTDLDQILARLFLRSYLNQSDCERINMINAYLPKVQVKVNQQLIAQAG